MVTLMRSFVCVALLLLGGCAGLPASNNDVQVSEFKLSLAGASQRDEGIVVHRYAPARKPPRAALVFAHGFLRGPARHAELAQRLAADGVLVLLPQFASPFDAQNLQRDAQVMLTLDAQARREAATVLWGGFSRGGSVTAEALSLASSAGEVKAIPAGILMLDPVWGARGAKVLASLNIPVRVLAAPAAGCNAQGRALAWPEARMLAADIVAGASHCDAESPSDLLCTLACGGPDAARQQQFLDGARAFVLSVMAGASTPAAKVSHAAPDRDRAARQLPASDAIHSPLSATAP